MVIVAFDGPIARFEAALDAEAFGRRALEYLRTADVGVATRRSRRKHLAFGGDEFSAVVPNMASLATAIRACPPMEEASGGLR